MPVPQERWFNPLHPNISLRYCKNISDLCFQGTALRMDCNGISRETCFQATAVSQVGVGGGGRFCMDSGGGAESISASLDMWSARKGSNMAMKFEFCHPSRQRRLAGGLSLAEIRNSALKTSPGIQVETLRGGW